MSITSQTGFLSEILPGGKIPQAKLAYFRERLRNRVHQFILQEFMVRQQEGMTQAKVARVLGCRPEQINRWLGNPGNWKLDSISDLMLAISKSELDFKAEPLEGLERKPPHDTRGEIEITPEMINAVLHVLYDHALPSLTRLAESPELAEAICCAVIAALDHQRRIN